MPHSLAASIIFFSAKSPEQTSNGLYLCNSSWFILETLKVLHITSPLIEFFVCSTGIDQLHTI